MGNTQLLLLLDCLYAVGDGRFYLFGYAFGEIGGSPYRTFFTGKQHQPYEIHLVAVGIVGLEPASVDNSFVAVLHCGGLLVNWFKTLCLHVFVCDGRCYAFEVAVCDYMYLYGGHCALVKNPVGTGVVFKVLWRDY